MTTTDGTDASDFFAEPADMTSDDGIEMKGGRYVLPTNDGMDGKWRAHTRATTVSRTLSNSYGLGVWGADRVAWAMAQRPDLCALLASVPMDDIATIREVRAKAEVVSATDEGANLGVATHNILARVDAGEPIDGLHRMFWPDIQAYWKVLAEYGLTVLPNFIERVVRMRDYGIAGRLDNIMTESDGTLVIVDKKTKGKPDSAHEIATQLAVYANADEMYDPATGRYEPMPAVRRDYALMIHMVPGSGVCEVKKIDIRRGLWSIEIARNVSAYQKMTHLVTPYVMTSPNKPADAALDARIASGPQEPVSAPEHLVRNGSVTPQVADLANRVLDEVHERVGSLHPHGIVTPAAYGAPAGVEPPPAYTPQTVPERAEAVLVTTGEAGVDQEAQEITAVFKSKSKAQLQAYARRYGVTDLNHHKAHIATSVAKVRADRRKAGLDPEPGGPEQVDKPRPNTLAETGLPPAPVKPPGMPVAAPDVDASEQTVLADIGHARTVSRIGEIWQRWTDAHGPESWSGSVAATADARVAEIRAGTAEIPF